MYHHFEVDRWLDNLQGVLSSSKNSHALAEPKLQEVYHFRFHLSHEESYYNRAPSMKVNMRIVFAKVLKSGKIGSYKAFDAGSKSHQHYLEEATKALLVEVRGLQSFTNSDGRCSNSYELSGKEGESILRKLLETGCCYWKDQKKDSVLASDVALHLGAEKAAEWHWKMDAMGFQSLHYHKEQESLKFFMIERLWYCNQQTGETGIVTTDLDSKTVTYLLALPKVPIEAAEKVANVLSKHQEKLPIHVPKVPTDQEIKKVKPIPCLRLFQTSITEYSEEHWGWRTSLKIAAQLTFDYEGVFAPSEELQSVIHHVKNNDVLFIKRDAVKERKCVQTMISGSWVPLASMPHSFLQRNRGLEPCFVMINGDPIAFSAYFLPQLEAEGWRIDIAEDYPYQVIAEDAHEWYSEIEEKSSYDWFGLELGITVKGEKINLLPVLQKVLQELHACRSATGLATVQEFLDQAGKSLFAQLPDGRHLALPMDRMRDILTIFIELYDSDSLDKNNKLRLSKLHAVRLMELEKALGAAQLRWFGGERLRKMGKKLTQFSGIEIVQPSPEFRGELRPYQIEGLSWLQFLREYDLSGILADDMGLGKTVQTLAHLLLEKKSGRMNKPSLIVAPTSLMFNWQMEAERFAPDLKVLLLHGAVRKELFEEIGSYDLILTTYPLIVRDADFLLKQEFYFLILDEAQFIKNANSKAAQVALQMKAMHRLCLTGTPMENHLGELWALFHFMMPGLLGDQKQFARVFRTPIEKRADHERRAHLNRRIAPFLLRRTKDKVMEELPEKVEMIRHVELEGAQRDLYETIRATMQKKVQGHIAKLGLNRSHIFILEALLKLRQVCCDPRLLKIPIAQKGQAASAKLELLMASLEELLAEGRKILLFSQFTEMLALIEEELHKKKIAYVKLTGQTKDRKTPVQQFQEGKVPLFLISLKAGGTGLNLTAADTVIHYDPWWNPAVEHQATDRAHRIGQNKTVFVYKFVTKGTVEEKILEMQRHKHALMEGLFSSKEGSKLKMSGKDLQSLFDPLE